MRPRAAPTWLPMAAFIAVCFSWGTTYAGMRVAVETIPPFTIAATRFTFAGAAMLGVLRLMGWPMPGRRDWLRIAPVGFLLVSFANGWVNWALQYVDSFFAAIMVNIAPLLFVALMALAGERATRRAWLGLVVGFVGVALLVTPRLIGLLGGEALGHAHPRFWWAFGALVLGPVGWATGSFIGRRYPASTPPLVNAAGHLLMGGLGASVFLLLLGEWRQWQTPSWTSLGAVAWLTVIGAWLGFPSYIYCLTHLPAARTATVPYINQILAVLVGTLILGEAFNLFHGLGGLTILAGVWVANSARRRRVPEPIDPEPPVPE